MPVVESNRHDQGEACFMSHHNKRLYKSLERIRQEKSTRDVIHKQNGYTHKFVGWVHPMGGGDDYQVTVYFKGRPSEKDAQCVLSKEGNDGITDYAIYQLK